MTTNSGKHGKLEKLIAVYEHFAQEIETIPDPWASKLAKQAEPASWRLRALGATLAHAAGHFAGRLNSGVRRQ